MGCCSMGCEESKRLQNYWITDLIMRTGNTYSKGTPPIAATSYSHGTEKSSTAATAPTRATFSTPLTLNICTAATAIIPAISY